MNFEISSYLYSKKKKKKSCSLMMMMCVSSISVVRRLDSWQQCDVRSSLFISNTLPSLCSKGASFDNNFTLPVEKLGQKKQRQHKAPIKNSIYLFCISNPERYVIKAEKPALLVLMTRKGCLMRHLQHCAS